MKKLFLVLVSILLLAGVAQAVDFDQAITGEFAAQNTGRSVVTDSSVLLRVWFDGGLDHNASVGVSADTIILYEDGASTYTVDTASTSYDTPGEIAGYINDQTGWHALVGPDAYDDYSCSAGLIASNNAYVGSNVASCASLWDDSSISTKWLVGVAKDDISQFRLKNINAEIASLSDNITIDVYDGNTRIWRKYITNAAYITTTAAAASTNTVIPTNDDKGLAATKGNSLCVVVDTDGAWDTDAVAKAADQLTITYDKLRN